MAELGNLKQKNADRLKRLERLKAAQSVPMPDPMIGYRKEPEPPAKAQIADPVVATPNMTDAQPEPVEEASQEAPVIEDAPPEAVHTPSEDAIEDAAGNRPEVSVPDEEALPDGDSPATGEAMTIFVTYRFAEADLARVEVIAKQLGVLPRAILMKVLQAVVVEDADYREADDQPRAGPSCRRKVMLPRETAEAWIKESDPLGIYPRPGDVLRKVAFNALDRKVEELLPQLEAKSRNAHR